MGCFWGLRTCNHGADVGGRSSDRLGNRDVSGLFPLYPTLSGDEKGGPSRGEIGLIRTFGVSFSPKCDYLAVLAGRYALRRS